MRQKHVKYKCFSVLCLVFFEQFTDCHSVIFSGTMPLPPPTFPPPPPPPIEDIPNRGGLTTQQQQQQHIQQQHHRQFQFGPQIRGNYSEVENLRRNFSDHDSVRRQYSEPECTCRSNLCSDGDLQEFEPHYLVQTPTGNVLIPQSQGNVSLVCLWGCDVVFCLACRLFCL